MQEGQASRTAVLVCQGRAAATGLLPTEVFCDEVAFDLLRPDEQIPVLQVRDSHPPRGWSARMEYERLRACAGMMAPRTLMIDDAILASPCSQLVILGAGLDDRAWRLPALADVDVYEVDHPDSQRDKRTRVGAHVPTCRSLTYVEVDFTRDRLDASLEAAGHDSGRSTTWLWEGVIAYLTPDQVRSTLAVIAERSVSGSMLIANYQTQSTRANVGRLVARGLSVLSRQPDLWGAEPWRSAWTSAQMRVLLAGASFEVGSDVDLLAEAQRRGLPVTHPRSLAGSRIAVASFA